MAINTMMAMHAAGIDVAARPVKLNSAKAEVPDIIKVMEENRPGGYDAVIQNILPPMMDFSGLIPKNIAYYCTETSSIADTSWPQKINCMDEAWVCNTQSRGVSINSGVSVLVRVIPIACDTARYERSYKPLSIRNRLGDSFIFYYIGDFNKRKNLSALIRAFHLEFDVNEPVNLVIKTNIGVGSNDDYHNIHTREIAIQEINKVKQEMKLYSSVEQYKQEIVLTGQYTEEEILRLHHSCDCFVCPSYGEAWSIPAFDAMAMGKTPIVTNGSGFLEWMGEGGWTVQCRPEPVFGMYQGTPEDMFTSRESWDAVDIYDLMRCMRQAYSNRELRKEKAAFGRSQAYQFSYDAVGKLISESLHG